MNFKQYDIFILTDDIGPEIRKGMMGTILETYNGGEAYEVEFVKEDGTNYQHEGNYTFSLKPDKMAQHESTT